VTFPTSARFSNDDENASLTASIASPESSSLTVAAIGDLHLNGTDADVTAVRSVMDAVSEADVLAVCGDLTCHGRPEEVRALAEAIGTFAGTVITVLGNHDYESDRASELVDILESAGAVVLDGDGIVLHGVGFVGVKGFGGGVGRGRVEAFGGRALKSFVSATLAEAEKLDHALRTVDAPHKIVIMHYAPVADTLRGEPEMIWPFLGSSRFAELIDQHEASVVFHGHAHLGAPEGLTPAGIPVFNVSLPVLGRAGLPCRVWTVPAMAGGSDAQSPGGVLLGAK
jgi:Icc-related predicted phosphoesterase